MKMLRELLSSDSVSSDEDMGDTEEPSSSTSKERKKGGRAGKETIEMYSHTINLVEMADTAEGGELQCGGVDLTYNPCGDSRTLIDARDGMRHHPVLHPEVRRHN